MSCFPTKEGELKQFASNFAALIMAAPNTYGLVANDGVQIKEATDDFVARYDLVQSAATRTVPNIVDKDAAKKTLLAILRGYGQQIKTNRAVLDSDKVKLGVGVCDLVRNPVTAPTTRPQINVAGVDLKRHELRFCDFTTPEKKGKPAGVLGLQFFCHVGEASTGAPVDPLASRFHSFITKPVLTMDFGPADTGKTAYYIARWQTATGLVGPWSQVASMPILG